MNMTPYSPYPSLQQHGSHTKTSAQKKWRGGRRKETGKIVSFDVKIGEKLIKEEVKEASARPCCAKQTKPA
jgi:hypothetical protein